MSGGINKVIYSLKHGLYFRNHYIQAFQEMFKQKKLICYRGMARFSSRLCVPFYFFLFSKPISLHRDSSFSVLIVKMGYKYRSENLKLFPYDDIAISHSEIAFFKFCMLF